MARFPEAASRVCNSILVAICVAPLVLIGGMYMLGWNERRAVCEDRAISQGRDKVAEVKCGSAMDGDGALVMFSCDLDKSSPEAQVSPSGDAWSNVSFVTAGLETRIEMRQCVERTRSKDASAYSVVWRSAWVDMSKFLSPMEAKKECGRDQNPAWDPDWPAAATTYAPSVVAGGFTLSQQLVKQVPLNKRLRSEDEIPEGWLLGEGDSYYYLADGENPKGIGRVRLNFTGNDWGKPKVTVLGENKKGTIGLWIAPSTWLCSGYSLAVLKSGTVAKAEFFSALAAQATMETYVLRVVGFLLLWWAFSRFLAPLGVAAECVPCLGPLLGESIHAIACFVSCLPGCACCLGVVGVVWVAMRPMVGIPMILAFLLTFGGYIGFRMRKAGPAVAADPYGPSVAMVVPPPVAMAPPASVGVQPRPSMGAFPQSFEAGPPAAAFR